MTGSPMRLAGLWRYPVESLGGEPLTTVGVPVEVVSTSEEPSRIGGWIVGAPYEPFGHP